MNNKNTSSILYTMTPSKQCNYRPRKNSFVFEINKLFLSFCKVFWISTQAA